MNRVLATVLEYLNYIIVLVIIAAGGYAGWLLFQGDPEPQQNAGVVSGVVLGVLVAALVGGAMALVVLMEKYLRQIRAHTISQTELLEQIASMAESDVEQAEGEAEEGGFGAPTWARTGQGS